jgi:uncharacterized alpha-E superfamily protein
LKRVHTILRRLDDDFCDPVELRADSALGVPGLLAAIRQGNVVVANALGSGVLESAAWLGFLPSIAERLLGERLILPSVATWWCGERPAFESVIANLENLVIKPTFPDQNLDAVFGSDLDAAEREALIERMRARPYAFVAQEHLAFSQAPVWYTKSADRFSARALGIRVYAIATPEGLPGHARRPRALRLRCARRDRLHAARRRQQGHLGALRLRRGGRGIDRAHRAVDRTAPRAAHQDLPSTLAENLFWMGRYAERCDFKMRMLRATLGLRRNLPFWSQAMEICKHYGAARLFDAQKRFTLSGDVGRLGECAARVRSSLSAENWRALTVLQRDYRRAENARADAREALDRLLISLAALAGFAHDDMTQDDGWRLMMIGRRLERLLFLSAVIARRLVHPATPMRQELEWLLEIGDSAITYRNRHRAPPVWAFTVDLLVYDERNPRALAFQWRAINTLLIEFAESLGTRAQDTLYAPISELIALKYAPLGNELELSADSRRRFAEGLESLNAAAGSSRSSSPRSISRTSTSRSTRCPPDALRGASRDAVRVRRRRRALASPAALEAARLRLPALPRSRAQARSAAELGARGPRRIRQRHRATRVRSIARPVVGDRRDDGRDLPARIRGRWKPASPGTRCASA